MTLGGARAAVSPAAWEGWVSLEEHVCGDDHPLPCPDSSAAMKFAPRGIHFSRILVGFVSGET